jgi:uncharacterized surface protein with fasciclin (FAS1) repeats
MNNLPNLLETVSNAGDLTLLLKGIHLAELTDTLNSEGSFTILAPTDEVFRQLPQEELDSLFENIPKLKRVLLYHVLFGDVRSDDLIEIEEAPTVEGSIIAIDHLEGKIHVNDAQVTELDLLASNGAIHKISAVLMPTIASHEYD